MKGSLVLTTAVLNAFFDIYSEENYNEVLKQLNVIQVLTDNTNNYKTLVFV